MRDRLLVNAVVAVLVGVLLVASPVAGALLVVFLGWLALHALTSRANARG